MAGALVESCRFVVEVPGGRLACNRLRRLRRRFQSKIGTLRYWAMICQDFDPPQGLKHGRCRGDYPTPALSERSRADLIRKK